MLEIVTNVGSAILFFGGLLYVCAYLPSPQCRDRKGRVRESARDKIYRKYITIM